jgi:hypothetical protein
MNAITDQQSISRVEIREKLRQTVAGDCPGESIQSRNQGRDICGSVLRYGPWNGRRDDCSL